MRMVLIVWLVVASFDVAAMGERVHLGGVSDETSEGKCAALALPECATEGVPACVGTQRQVRPGWYSRPTFAWQCVARRSVGGLGTCRSAPPGCRVGERPHCRTMVDSYYGPLGSRWRCW